MKKLLVAVFAIYLALSFSTPVDAGIQFQGFKTFYIVDSEADINPAWQPQTSIYSVSTKLNYVMQADGIYTSGMKQTISSATVVFSTAGATGFQISSGKNSTIRISASTSATANIGGASTSLIILKVCATNSGTEGDWSESGRLETDNTVTLAVTLQSVNLGAGQITADLPAGWFYKLEKSGTGTHTEAIISAQQTIYG